MDDLERSLRFYRDGLGFQTPGIVGTEFEVGAVVFFDLQGGLKLALWPRDHIARDAKVPKSRRAQRNSRWVTTSRPGTRSTL